MCSILYLSEPPPCGRRLEQAACKVDLCIHANKVQDAVHLIHLGARAGLVSQATRLEKRTVNRLYRQLCGTPSPSGQMPFTDGWYRENDLRMLHATLAWKLYQRLALTKRSAARVLIDVYQAYTLLVSESQLDLTRTVSVFQLVAMRLWHERTCKFCGTDYLSAVDSNGIACPGCRLYHRHRCHRCTAPIEAQPKGRPRVTCGSCGNTDNGGIRH